jgi:DNA repair exonuclease SbcCD ATPase subunit
MGLSGSIIETGVDKLVKLINIKARISSSDAARELGVSSTVVMEWADFLEEEGIISIEYKFTKPYLVSRKMTKKEVEAKSKEFSGKKDVFIRKAEVSLSFLEREAKKLNKVKEEFDKIKKELGFDIDNIKNELEELEKYEQLKISLDKQIEDQKSSAFVKLQEISAQISREKKKYQDVLSEIENEEKELQKEKEAARSIEQSEKIVRNRLNSLKGLISAVESKVKAEEESLGLSEKNIERLSEMAETMKARVEKEKGSIEPLIGESQNQVKKIKELQETMIKKLTEKEKKLQGAKKVSKKVKSLFKKKMNVLTLIEKVNKDRNDLQQELVNLIKKAKSFQLSSKTKDIGKEMADIEKKFKDVDNKKGLFETELKKLSSFFR